MSIPNGLQLPLFGVAQDPQRVINVASVKQLSPFRYPGGKTWLVPLVTRWLIQKQNRPKEFVEPFAGGGIIGLTVAFQNLADHVTLVELDEQVAAVWKTMLEGDFAWLAERIATFDLTAENADQVLATQATSLEEKAFQTILKNRIQRGGILAPGAGRIKNGENGKGLKSRWYPETLKKRILTIAKLREKISFVQGNGLTVMGQYQNNPQTCFFIDPPYSADGKKAGTRLYTHFELDHERLFQIASSLHGDFLMTYDSAPGVQALSDKFGFDAQAVLMKNTHHAEMDELLIGRDLGWIT